MLYIVQYTKKLNFEYISKTFVFNVLEKSKVYRIYCNVYKKRILRRCGACIFFSNSL